MLTGNFSLPNKIYALLIGGLGHGLLIWGLALTLPAFQPEQWAFALVLSALGVLLNAIGVRLPLGVVVGLEATAYYAAMLSLNPWIAGLVAGLPIYRWRLYTPAMSNWYFFRTSGMYILIGISGGFGYLAAGGAVPLHSLSPINLFALIVALVVGRVVNEFIFFWWVALARGPRPAYIEFRDSQVEAWAVEALAYFPALLTALIYNRVGAGGLLIWLVLLSASAVAVYQLMRTRTAASEQLAELSTVNDRMREHNELETTLAGELSEAAEGLAGYASRLVEALRQQHEAVAQITSTVEQLAQQAHYIAEAAGAVDTTSEAALAMAGRGQEAAASSVQAMEDLEGNVHEMNSGMTMLESRSRLIYRTLGTINNISRETHLLALNATIEAAGAMGQSRRFSVVAQQINSLADQALRAAAEIQGTVREIEEATADTKTVIEQGLAETRRYTSQVDEARRSMEVILNALGRASEMAQQIRQATQQQTQASNQVTDAMREIAGSMGAASTEGRAVYTAAENLRLMAHELRTLDAPTPDGHQNGA